VYEVSLPDIHYGKIDGQTLDEAEEVYMNTVKDLMNKASGLNIERILLPVGNDGMNSEGYSRATTKGTSQQDSAPWQETFIGYCNLMVRAITFLAKTAPVDVIVIQGNHDYERMFYSGEFLRAFFLNDKRVTVDNNYNSRKYYKYGTNMIMFTHGDKEKKAEMPLIMATEEPQMFAETTHREVHCGHLHKEMVNEYRGIKVRFIPSICGNDEWHKMMGYEAKRTGQAHIWNKLRGYEGYLQTNV
jgi:predicted phosphodiesterase